ncbi:hypothetical protein AB0I60_04235 [Actinosynnema sp. NPDC050436]|uniref:hypothetical protein n=1 Tax=Actinosynnema sp. NPDC050436 TaxID=3155659 RepID=UPI0033D8778C
MTGPTWHRLSPSRAQEMRTSCTRLGVVVIAAAVVLALLLVAVGLSLRTPRNALDATAWIFGASSVLPLVSAGAVLVNARVHVRSEHLDLAGARKARRGLAVLWACTLLSSGLAAAARLSGISLASNGGFGPISPANWVYLLLLLVVIGLGSVAFAAGRTTLRPSTPIG